MQQYQGIRDGVLFTDRRIIAVNTQGFTGRKKAFVVMPYSRIQAYSIESAGVIDFDSEVRIWLAGLGMATFELVAGADIFALARLIGSAFPPDQSYKYTGPAAQLGCRSCFATQRLYNQFTIR